mmetsp:Transcript_12374/g.10456  ORF Transcript_12374/g.10456 Transcript_12374/m.10456 type:complete len:150 (+) Transcript_12374:147-596(+)
MKEVKKIIPEVSVRIYGSFMTGITLEESDIDLVLFHTVYGHKNIIIRGLKDIKSNLDGSQYVVKTTLIETAVVPVLKVDIDLNKYDKKGIRTKNKCLILNFDLSFKADNVHNGDSAVDLINFFKSKNKMLIPVTLIIKRLLMMKGLNSA